MATLTVQPRQTPAERASDRNRIKVSAELADYAAIIEEWIGYRANWEMSLREGHLFGKADNVECLLLFAGGEQTSSLSFRLDQLSRVDDTGEELVLICEESSDGHAKLARLNANGLALELFHLLTFT